MNKKTIKKYISLLIISYLLFWFLWWVSSSAKFIEMDVCNYTNWDHSWDYYDRLCTKDWKKAENSSSFVKTNNNSTKQNTNTGSTQSKKELKKHKLSDSNVKIHNTIFWLSPDRNKTKDKQLCKISSKFEYYNFKWELVTYYPQACQTDTNTWVVDNTGSQTSVDESIKTVDDETMDDIFNSIFNENNDSWTTNTWVIEDNTWTTDDSDLDNLLNDVFWLKGKDLARTIKDFSKNKLKAKVGNIEVSFINWDNLYNEKMAFLLNNVDKTFKIESIKQDFAKKISNLSYSFYTYKNAKDLKVKKVFEEKLKRDINEVKKKYKVLKFKDKIISKTLQARWVL